MDSEKPTNQAPSDSPVRVAWLERPAYVAAILLCVALVLVWANLNQPFYSIDDDLHLHLATETPISSTFALHQDQTPLPLSHLSLRLDRFLFGPSYSETLFKLIGHVGRPLDEKRFYTDTTWSTGTRAMNVLYHAVAGFLLWCFLRSIGVSAGVALLVAVAWTGHPMACESVCWISERKNVLAALFGFAALWAWTLPSRGWRWPLATLLFALATLSKPTAVGFFAVMAMLEIIDLRGQARPSDAPPSSRWVDLVGLLGPLLVTLCILYVNIPIHAVGFVEPLGGSLFTALLTDLDIFARYMFNIIIPVNLSFYYGVLPILSLADPRVWLYGAAILAIVVLSIGLSEGPARRRAAFGILWFFAALGPHANIAPIHFWMEDRYAYFAAPGLLLALMECANSVLAQKKRADLAGVLGLSFALFIITLAAMRSPTFKDNETLTIDASERQPYSGMAQVCAWNAYKNRAMKPADPAKPEEGKAKIENAYKAIVCFERATHCADLTNFEEAFEMRARTAEIALHQIGNAQMASNILKDWLPPAHLKQRDTTKEIVAADMKYFYEPETLLYAQLVAIEAHLTLANPSQLTLAEFPIGARLSACRATLAESERAKLPKNQSAILRAKILVVLSDLEEVAKDKPNSIQHFEAAKILLQSVPKTSQLFPEANYLLSTIRPPDFTPKQNVNPAVSPQ